MEILIFKTHFFKFEISKGAVIRSGMVQSDMWNKQAQNATEEKIQNREKKENWPFYLHKSSGISKD